MIFVSSYFVITKRSKSAIYTVLVSVNGDAKPTHIVRLVATLSSSIKESGTTKRLTNRLDRRVSRSVFGFIFKILKLLRHNQSHVLVKKVSESELSSDEMHRILLVQIF